MGSEFSWENILDFFLDWTMALVHPIDNCQRLLAITDEKARLRSIFKMWFASVVVSLVVYLPIYHRYGIGLSNIDFEACFILGFTVTLIAYGFAIQAGLRLHHIRSQFSDILAMYAAFFICYQPLYIVVSYPQSFHFFEALNNSKHNGTYFLQAVVLYVRQSHRFATEVNAATVFSTVCSWVLFLAICTSTALLIRAVAEKCATTKEKSFSAITFTSIAILPPLVFLQSFLIAYIVFAFMKS
jgi:hypothetical protein